MITRIAQPDVRAWWPLLFLLGLAMALLPSAKPSAARLQGRIAGGVYHGGDGQFSVAVPRMRNPFIKEPTVIRDRVIPGERVEVDFAVPDLGEGHRFGARHLGADDEFDALFEEELARWAQDQTGVAGVARLVTEGEIVLHDGPAAGRVYLVEGASLLFGSKGGAAPRRESALVGVAILPLPDARRALYFVSQFDMPNRGGYHTLDTEQGTRRLAQQHLQGMRSLAESLRLN